MSKWLDRVRRFLVELKRRHVYRVGAAYAAVAIVVIQAASLAVPALLLPEVVYRGVVMVVVLGFPVALVLAWAFEISPEGGARRTPSGGKDAEEWAAASWIGGGLVLAAAGAAGAVATGAIDVGGAGATRSAVAADSSSAATSAESESARKELDPGRVAVLYFDDHSRGDSLSALARGLTEDLIHRLENAGGLEVLSRHAVSPYRDGDVTLDSMIAALGAGSIVEGSVEPMGTDSVQATVQLIDSGDRTHRMSRKVRHSAADPFVLQEKLAGEVSRLLRRRLGRTIRLANLRAETSSAEAWRSVQQAEEFRAEARELVGSGPEEAVRRLVARADSLLARAAGLDTTWSEPLVLRARLGRILVSPYAPRWTDEQREEMRSRLRYAERAVEKGAGRAAPLVARGQIRFWLSQHSTDEVRARELLDAAEADLREATRVDRSSARGWYALSVLLHEGRGELEEARYAAQQARKANSFLTLSSGLIRHQMFATAINEPNYRVAEYWCDLGREQHPGSIEFRACELILLASDGGPPPEPGRARTLVDEIASLANPGRRDFFTALAWRRYAAVLARAGRPDSARSVLNSAPRAGPPGALTYEEAHVYLLLGEDDTALELLRAAIRDLPQIRPQLREDPWFAPLREDPGFRSLVKGDGA